MIGQENMKEEEEVEDKLRMKISKRKRKGGIGTER